MPNFHLEKQLMRHEGFSDKPYRCSSGSLTIGFGRNLEGRGVSRSEALLMLTNDIRDARADVFEILHSKEIATWKLSATRLETLINMAFNMGHKRLYGFAKMWQAIADENWPMAAREMLDSTWAKQVGKRAIELARQMKTGKYQEVAK